MVYADNNSPPAWRVRGDFVMVTGATAEAAYVSSGKLLPALPRFFVAIMHMVCDVLQAFQEPLVACLCTRKIRLPWRKPTAILPGMIHRHTSLTMSMQACNNTCNVFDHSGTYGPRLFTGHCHAMFASGALHSGMVVMCSCAALISETNAVHRLHKHKSRLVMPGTHVHRVKSHVCERNTH